MRIIALILLLAVSAVAQDTPFQPTPSQPQPAAKQEKSQPLFVATSAVEQAQIELATADSKKHVKEAKRLLQRAHKLRAELQAIEARLNQLNTQVVGVVKAR